MKDKAEIQRSKRTKKRLAANLVTARTNAGMTQAEVCEVLKWDATLLSRYETGSRCPRAKKIIQLARLYKVEPHVLTGINF